MDDAWVCGDGHGLVGEVAVRAGAVSAVYVSATPGGWALEAAAAGVPGVVRLLAGDGPAPAGVAIGAVAALADAPPGVVALRVTGNRVRAEAVGDGEQTAAAGAPAPVRRTTGGLGTQDWRQPRGVAAVIGGDPGPAG